MPIYNKVVRHRDAEIIIAEDGSYDCSKKIAMNFARLRNVRLISRRRRIGKGGAICNAISVAKGDVIGYMDIDLAVPLRYVEMAVKKVEEGNPIVLGSRYAKGASTERSRSRLAESMLFNLMMRIFLGSRISDHQCGFKFWDGRYIRKAVKEVHDNRWFFDSEILVRAQRRGIVPYEMPVVWREGDSTKVGRTDFLYFFGAIMKLRKEL
ncbi:MAG: glycosyltransferase [Candidatus Marsarchaeota archaeon]|nr:glycosyltransferase [Candidatus Marsarchaeota archaeon]MCL5412883.1 glycosyltransferase [Candidatus Marsarchaeota archaeon]